MRSLGRSWRSLAVNLAAITAASVFLFPYLYMLASALKKRLEVFAYPPVWLFHPSLENFELAFTKYGLGTYLTNSVIVSLSATVLTFLLALPATLAIARFRFRFREGIAYSFLIMQLLPAIALVFAYFFLFTRLAMIDTPWVLTVTYQLWNVPWAIWMLRGFIQDIPVALEEAAMTDGCTRLEAFRRVTLPVAAPGLAAAGILIFIGSWNEFTLAFFLTSLKARTLPTTIGFFLTHSGIEWGPMFATAAIATLPIVLFSLVVRKYFISALTFGAVKG